MAVQGILAVTGSLLPDFYDTLAGNSSICDLAGYRIAAQRPMDGYTGQTMVAHGDAMKDHN